MDLNQLECFCAVVRGGSFSKAASALSLGQPSVSRQVRRLEEEVGSRLLYRNGRGVELTVSGGRFYEVVADLIVRLQEAYEQAADDEAAPFGVVTLGLPSSMSGLVGAPLFQALRSECPRIQLVLVEGLSGHVHDWLLSSRVDLAILHDRRHAPTLATEHLLSEDLFLVGIDEPPDACFVNGYPAIAYVDAAALPLLTLGANHGLRLLLDRLSAETRTALNVVGDVDSVIAIRELVTAKVGYSILPIGCVYNEVALGQLKAWRIVRPTVINTLVLAASNNRPFTTAMREVRRALKVKIADVAQSQIAWSVHDPSCNG